MSRTVIWRPGATGLTSYRDWRGVTPPGEPRAGAEDSTINGNLVVATDQEVAQIIAEHGGDVTVVVDASLTGDVATMTPGVTWAAPNGGVLALSTPKAGTKLDATGAFVGPFARAENIEFTGQPTKGPLFAVSSVLISRTLKFSNKAESTAPLVVVADLARAVFESEDGVVIDNSATVGQPIFKVGVSAVGGQAAQIDWRVRGTLAFSGANPITTPNASASVSFKTDSNTDTGVVAGVFRAFTGTIAQVSKDSAFGAAYVPSTLANWSGTAPTSVGNALDRIAAKITPVG